MFICIGKFKDSDSISLDEFVNRVVGKIGGSGGLTVNALLQSDVEMEAYKQAGIVSKVCTDGAVTKAPVSKKKLNTKRRSNSMLSEWSYDYHLT